MIKPVIEKRFNEITDIYQNQGKITSLQGYLESENISYDRLKDFIEKIANTTKNLFKKRSLK